MRGGETRAEGHSHGGRGWWCPGARVRAGGRKAQRQRLPSPPNAHASGTTVSQQPHRGRGRKRRRAPGGVTTLREDPPRIERAVPNPPGTRGARRREGRAPQGILRGPCDQTGRSPHPGGFGPEHRSGDEPPGDFPSDPRKAAPRAAVAPRGKAPPPLPPSGSNET